MDSSHDFDRCAFFKEHGLFLLILAASCSLLLGLLTTGHEWGSDFSAYIMQARSLVEGTPHNFVATNRFAMEHSSRPLGPVAYPWGFPIILVPIYLGFGLDLMALKMAGFVAYALFVTVLYAGFKKEHSKPWLLCLVGFFAFHYILLSLVDTIMSDVPFLLFSTLAVVLMKRTVVEHQTVIAPVWDKVLLGVAIAVAVYIRTNGVLLVAALAGTQLLSWAYGKYTTKGLRAAAGQVSSTDAFSGLPLFRSSCITMLPYGIFVFSFMVGRVLLPEGGGAYLDFLSRTSLPVVISNFWYNIDITRVLFGSSWQYYATIPFLMIGVVQGWRSNYHAILYVILTLALYCIWPARQGLRFMLPVLPFYVSFVLMGLQAAAEWTRQAFKVHYVNHYLTVFLAMIALLLFQQSMHFVRVNLANERKTPAGPYSPASLDMFAFIKERTGSGDIIIFRKPRVMRLMTERMSLLATNVGDIALGDYLVLGDDIGTTALEGIVPGANVFADLAYKNEKFRVYRLK